MKIRPSSVLYHLTFGLLLFVVLRQVAQQVGKHLRRQTTNARSVRHHRELPPPAVSFCPGYRRERAEAWGLVWSVWGFEGDDDAFDQGRISHKKNLFTS